jgi:hypothetical protein
MRCHGIVTAGRTSAVRREPAHGARSQGEHIKARGRTRRERRRTAMKCERDGDQAAERTRSRSCRAADRQCGARRCLGLLGGQAFADRGAACARAFDLLPTGHGLCGIVQPRAAAGVQLVTVLLHASEQASFARGHAFAVIVCTPPSTRPSTCACLHPSLRGRSPSRHCWRRGSRSSRHRRRAFLRLRG